MNSRPEIAFLVEKVSFFLKGLSQIGDLMPEGGVEATVFILEGLPRSSTPPILTHIFRIWHRFLCI